MDPESVNSVVHLELHTGDLQGAVAFYSQLLGWRPERICAGKSTYTALGMGDRLGGGVIQCPVAPQPLWLPYVQVQDLAGATERAQGLGAEVMLAPREGPEGWRSVVSTPTGGEVAFWQAKNGRR